MRVEDPTALRQTPDALRPEGLECPVVSVASHVHRFELEHRA
jgi:hypothetical protein